MNNFKKLPDIPSNEQTPLTQELIQMVLDLQENVRDLHDEILRLKGLKGRPKIKASKMDSSTSPSEDGDGKDIGEDGLVATDGNEKYGYPVASGSSGNSLPYQCVGRD